MKLLKKEGLDTDQNKLMVNKSSLVQHKNWSGEVTKHSNALDLEKEVFTWKDPLRIAISLKRSAECSTRRKTTPYVSSMSMLNFYINRAGKNLDTGQKRVLEQAKDELRKAFGRSARLPSK